MGTRLYAILEYDGEDSLRNDYVCELDDVPLIHLKYWKDLFAGGDCLGAYPTKERSLEALKLFDGSFFCSYIDVNQIIPQIEILKEKTVLDPEYTENCTYDADTTLDDVISDLQDLYDLAIEKCTQYKLDPKRCYVFWEFAC